MESSSEGGEIEDEGEEVMEVEVDLEETEEYQKRKLWPCLVAERGTKNEIMGRQDLSEAPYAPGSGQDRMETMLSRFL